MTILNILYYTSIGYTALTLILYALSPMSQLAGFLARLLASYVSLIICALYGATASIIMRLAGHGQSAQWATARAFKYVMMATTGVTFEIRDPNHVLDTTRPAVFIGNHQTELDVLMLGCMFPKNCSVTAKSTLKMMPFLGWFMMLSGTVFIDRKRSKGAREAMAGAAEEMRTKRQSVYMFPEGTRSYAAEPTLLPFKKGAFHLAVQAQVPIVPVVVANYSNVLSVKKMRFTSGSIPVKVLEPISTTGMTPADVDRLCQESRDRMLKEIESLTIESRGQTVPMSAAAPQTNGPHVKVG